MSILFNTVYRYECTSTHHKLAMDALRHLRGKQAEPWLRLFTRYYEDYLEGSKAPDKEFRDFRNHVLHVGDNYWGGVVKAANKWYDRAVESLVKQDYVEAVYCAGVLSHYYTDVLMPFHTAQTEAEGKVHRAFEWSVCKSYDSILPLVETYPEIETPAGDNWLEQMIRKGAVAAHEHYDAFVHEYDLERGRKRPQEGLNDGLRERLAGLFGHAIVGTSRILERIFQDSQAKPPRVRIGLFGAMTRLTSPFGKLSQYRAFRAEKKVISRIYREWVRTGCVIDSLPADEREVRKIHAEEVLGVSEDELNRLTREAAAQRLAVEAAAAGAAKSEAKTARAEEKAAKADAKAAKNKAMAAAKAEARAESKRKQLAGKHAQPTNEPTGDSTSGSDGDDHPPTVRITAESASEISQPLTFHLDRQSPIVDAPSIGSKTARRLQRVGVHTVDDLLALNPEEAAEELNSGYITPQTLRQWQSEASLVCRIPNLRGHDAQMLVGCKMLDPQIIANMAPGELLDRVEEYLLSEEGERLLTRAKEPDREEVTNWIRWAQQSRKLAAA